MEYQEMIISNVHTRGFAFAVCRETGEQVFIPPFVALAQKLEVGVTVQGRLVVNPKNGDSNTTPWQCISIQELDQEINPEHEPNRRKEDGLVLAVLQKSHNYYTAEELGEELGISSVTAYQSAISLFFDGKIVKAEVITEPNQEHPTISLWGVSVASFIGE